MNNEVLDGVGPLKPPTFGNSSFIPTVQTERAAISPESRPCTCPVARQKARMAQRGIESLQRSRSPCRWGGSALLGIQPMVMGLAGHRQVLPCLYSSQLKVSIPPCSTLTPGSAQIKCSDHWSEIFQVKCQWNFYLLCFLLLVFSLIFGKLLSLISLVWFKPWALPAQD